MEEVAGKKLHNLSENMPFFEFHTKCMTIYYDLASYRILTIFAHKTKLPWEQNFILSLYEVICRINMQIRPQMGQFPMADYTLQEFYL